MQVILGLDISKNRTGWGLLADADDDWTRPYRIACGTFGCEGGDIAESSAAMSDELTALIRRLRADGLRITAAAIEDTIKAPPMRVKQTERGPVAALASDPVTMLTLNALVGAAAAILRQWRCPVALVASQTWRKTYIGTGTAPRSVGKGKGRDWLKGQAMRKSAALALLWGFEVPNHDASDALGITIHHALTLGSKCAAVAVRRQPKSE